MPVLLLLVALSFQDRQSAAAAQVFARCEAKLKSAKTLSCTITTAGVHKRTDAVLMAKPDLFRVTSAFVITYRSGSKLTVYYPKEKMYDQFEAKSAAPSPEGSLDSFFGRSSGLSEQLVKGVSFEMKVVDGKRCAVKTQSMKFGGSCEFYVDARTNLPVGSLESVGRAPFRATITNLRLNVPVPTGALEFHPKPDDRPVPKRPKR